MFDMRFYKDLKPLIYELLLCLKVLFKDKAVVAVNRLV